jgi:phosphoserine phosphatase
MRIFQEHEKALFLKQLSRRLKIPLSQTVVAGDSRSDREVFKVAGFKIAVNPDKFLKGLGDVEVRGRDLRKVLAAL